MKNSKNKILNPNLAEIEKLFSKSNLVERYKIDMVDGKFINFSIPGYIGIEIGSISEIEYNKTTTRIICNDKVYLTLWNNITNSHISIFKPKNN